MQDKRQEIAPPSPGEHLDRATVVALSDDDRGPGAAPPPYRLMAGRAVAGVLAGTAVLAAGYLAGLLVAYWLAQGSIAGAMGPDESSYLASDVHAVLRRGARTMGVVLLVWPLVHYYGRRGPVMAAAFAVATGAFGFLSFAHDAGPLERPGQYAAYALPVFAALMLTWRMAYRRWW